MASKARMPPVERSVLSGASPYHYSNPRLRLPEWLASGRDELLLIREVRLGFDNVVAGPGRAAARP
jgi:hypothetical protein